MGYLLEKKRLKNFLALLMQHSSFVAPVKRESDGVVIFEELAGEADLARLDFTINPQFTAKRFFMPPYEELFTYDMKTQKIIERKVSFKERIIFGLRLCDLNAVRIQDKLFINSEFVDDHYRAARDSTFLVGWYCNTPPSKFCFCESMELVNYYDLMLREPPGDEKEIYIDVGSPRGEVLMRKVLAKKGAEALRLREHSEPIPAIKTRKKLKSRDLRKHFENPLWEKIVSEQCFSCQRCTLLCPTCMCFDVYDTTRLDLRRGARERSWDSCHSKEFTRVAGDHYFRPDRTARFKHRVYHKLVYYPEVFGTPMCTGCGRCIEQCPTQIDFVEIVNAVVEGEKR